MTYEIIFAGSGGQGIMLIGQILAMAGMLENKNVTWFPSYGAEMRGGTANCSVIVSDQIIGSPVISRPWGAVIMNQPSLEKFAPLIKPNGILVVNSSLTDGRPDRYDIEIMLLPFTQMADEMGSTKVANIIALSAFCAKTKIVTLKGLEMALQSSLAKKSRLLFEINKKALTYGLEKGLQFK